MATTPTINPQAFADKFRQVIRIGLNWDRFLKENWPIQLVNISSKSQLERCFVPWYIGTNGDEVAYDYPGAVPMTLTDVPKALSLLNDERKGDIQHYVDTFNNHKGLVTFDTPTYAMPDGRYFVMDGNHRLAALTLTTVPFNVTLWNVCGPPGPEGLLDLVHFQSK